MLDQVVAADFDRLGVGVFDLPLHRRHVCHARIQLRDVSWPSAVMLFCEPSITLQQPLKTLFGTPNQHTSLF